jgi:hypothetical protein
MEAVGERLALRLNRSGFRMLPAGSIAWFQRAWAKNKAMIFSFLGLGAKLDGRAGGADSAAAEDYRELATRRQKVCKNMASVNQTLAKTQILDFISK